MTDLINSLEALAGKVTPGPLMAQEDPCDGQDYKVLVTTAPNRTFPGTWVLRAEHNWQEAGYGERRISWKEAEANAELICLLRNNLPTIIAALKLAELVRDEDWLVDQIRDYFPAEELAVGEHIAAAREIIAAMGEEVK